jgi:anti-sigma factor RsiW
MANINQKLLERYYDGELSPKKAKQIEDQLANDAEHRESYRQMSQIGDLLRLMNEEDLNTVSFDGFEQRVAAGISVEEKPGMLEQLGIWISEFFAYRKAIWIPTTAAVGIAMVALLIVPAVLRSNIFNGASPPAIVTYEASIARTGSKIESVTFEGMTAVDYRVSKIDGQDGTIGVVWIVDTQ